MSFRTSSFAIDVPDALLARLRSGDRAAFEQVYRWFERPVFTLALRMCDDREQASEVLQDTMLKVFDRIGDFRGAARTDVRTDARPDAPGGDAGPAPFWGWLRQIAVNEALMALRRRRRHEDDIGGDDIDLPDDLTPPPPAVADAALLQRALQRLPATTRSVLWLYHAEGYTHEQIAALMQRTPSFSKSQLSRGLRRLRVLLDDPSAPAPDHAAAETAREVTRA